jgi:hypothetical protein
VLQGGLRFEHKWLELLGPNSARFTPNSLKSHDFLQLGKLMVYIASRQAE